MRIISQDGTIDIPYGLSALSIGCNATQTAFNVCCRSKLLDDKPCIIALYASEKNALIALRKMWSHYQYLKECEIVGVGSSQPEFVFRFPKDKEIEV